MSRNIREDLVRAGAAATIATAAALGNVHVRPTETPSPAGRVMTLQNPAQSFEALMASVGLRVDAGVKTAEAQASGQLFHIESRTTQNLSLAPGTTVVISGRSITALGRTESATRPDSELVAVFHADRNSPGNLPFEFTTENADVRIFYQGFTDFNNQVGDTFAAGRQEAMRLIRGADRRDADLKRVAFWGNILHQDDFGIVVGDELLEQYDKLRGFAWFIDENGNFFKDKREPAVAPTAEPTKQAYIPPAPTAAPTHATIFRCGAAYANDANASYAAAVAEMTKKGVDYNGPFDDASLQNAVNRTINCTVGSVVTNATEAQPFNGNCVSGVSIPTPGRHSDVKNYVLNASAPQREWSNWIYDLGQWDPVNKIFRGSGPLMPGAVTLAPGAGHTESHGAVGQVYMVSDNGGPATFSVWQEAQHQDETKYSNGVQVSSTYDNQVTIHGLFPGQEIRIMNPDDGSQATWPDGSPVVYKANSLGTFSAELPRGEVRVQFAFCLGVTPTGIQKQVIMIEHGPNNHPELQGEVPLPAGVIKPFMAE